MRRARAVLAAASAAALLLAAAPPARADVEVTTGVGFEGAYVRGCLTPLRIRVKSTEKDPITCNLVVESAGGAGRLSGGRSTYSLSVYLAPGAEKRFTIPVLARRPVTANEWQITIGTDRKALIRHGAASAQGKELPATPVVTAGTLLRDIPAGEVVIGVLGDPQGRLAPFDGERNRQDEEPTPDAPSRTRSVSVRRGTLQSQAPEAWLPNIVVVRQEEAPEPWLCYEGLDALLWVDPEPAALPDPAQLDAVLEYAACGGRLRVALTPRAQVAPASPLATALPAAAVGHDEVDAAVVAQALGVTALEGIGNAKVAVARLSGVRGRVTARLPDGRPLVVEAERGLGTVAVLAFDPRPLAALEDAQSRAAVVHAVSGCALDAGPAGLDPSGRYTVEEVSLEVLVEHLRRRFLSPPEIGFLVLGLLLYVLAIGPLDYFLLKRRGALRRTVITFPLMVVGFTVLAWASSFLLFGASAGRVRVAWLDFATAPGGNADVVRGVDILGAYYPGGRTLDLEYDFPRGAVEAPWIGSGAGLGQGAPLGLDASIAFGPDGRPSARVPVPFRSHRAVQARFSGEVPGGLDAAVKTGPDGKRSLRVRNDLKAALRDAVFLVEGWTIPVGTIGAGSEREVALPPARDCPPRIPWPDPERVRFPTPFDQGQGLFGMTGLRDSSRYGEAPHPCVALDDAREHAEGARRAMAAAATGATFGGLQAADGEQGPARSRTLAKHGVDLTEALRRGRPMLLGWCDADPLGRFPAAGNEVSTVVVVRRLLPAPGEEAR